jgi:F-type H+-transporting ATPase subunit delta
MRYTASEYARALYEVLSEQDESQADETISRFVSDMKDRGQLALLPEVLKEMPAAIKNAQGIEDVLIESAHEIDQATAEAALKALGKRAEDVEVTLAQNEGLIGGIRVKGRDTVIDASVRGRLNKLRDAFLK